jgi:flagellar biosynthesis chaperone FliJ
MNEESVERAIQFLLDNQAGHDARLARLEETVQKLGDNLNKLSEITDELSEKLFAGVGQMRQDLEALTAMSERTMAMVQQVTHNQVAVNRWINDADAP